MPSLYIVEKFECIPYYLISFFNISLDTHFLICPKYFKQFLTLWSMRTHVRNFRHTCQNFLMFLHGVCGTRNPIGPFECLNFTEFSQVKVEGFGRDRSWCQDWVWNVGLGISFHETVIGSASWDQMWELYLINKRSYPV